METQITSEKFPRIITELPGPKARKVIESDHRYISPSYTRPYPLVAKSGSGAIVEDVDGNRFLDFNAGIAVCSTGHCHPDVVRAIQRQAESLIHMSGTDFYYELMPQVARKLESLIPGGKSWRCFFGNSGTEAIEAALKLARYATGRWQFIAFHSSFHGRTMGALSLTSSKPVQRKGFGPLVPGVTHIPYGTCKYLEDVVFKTTVNPAEVAAIVVEPIQGESGYIVPPLDFLPALETSRHYYDRERHRIRHAVGRDHGARRDHDLGARRACIYFWGKPRVFGRRARNGPVAGGKICREFGGGR